MDKISYKNITRIKNVTHSDQHNGASAYLDISESEFVLHWPNRYQGNILEAGTNELIVVYQSLNNSRYLTHLVQPVDNELVEYVVDPNFQFGRYVRTIAYTGRDNAIPLGSLPHLDLRNSFGSARRIEGIVGDGLENYQRAYWNAFEPFMAHDLRDPNGLREIIHNDDLERDFESAEGKLLFANHRRRERDSRLVVVKKKLAKSRGFNRCEVCTFSFESTYGQDYIECHHTVPISEGERITKLEDLALVCSNCHRMLHRKIDNAYLSVHELKVKFDSMPN